MIILPGLTTTKRSDWREKIKEIDRLGLKEISIFPTPFDPEQRRHLYSLLEKTNLKSIPHVHIREQDTTVDELKYLSKRWETKLYNIHPTERGINFVKSSGVFKNHIYLENTGVLPPDFEDAIKQTAGICIDFSHWQDYWFLQKHRDYKQFNQFVEKYKIGCCHVNATGKEKYFDDYGQNNQWHYNKHHFDDLREFDYLKNFTKYLPPIISLELENSFEDQLRAKKYIEKLISS